MHKWSIEDLLRLRCRTQMATRIDRMTGTNTSAMTDTVTTMGSDSCRCAFTWTMTGRLVLDSGVVDSSEIECFDTTHAHLTHISTPFKKHRLHVHFNWHFSGESQQGSHWPGKSGKVWELDLVRESQEILLVVRENFYILSVFFSSCGMNVTFFNRSLTVNCLKYVTPCCCWM